MHLTTGACCPSPVQTLDHLIRKAGYTGSPITVRASATLKVCPSPRGFLIQYSGMAVTLAPAVPRPQTSQPACRSPRLAQQTTPWTCPHAGHALPVHHIQPHLQRVPADQRGGAARHRTAAAPPAAAGGRGRPVLTGRPLVPLPARQACWRCERLRQQLMQQLDHPPGGLVAGRVC